MTLICGSVRLIKPKHEVRQQQRRQQRRRGANSQREALRERCSMSTSTKLSPSAAWPGGAAGKRFQQRFGHDAMSADGNEHGQREKVKQLREDRHVFFEGRVEHVGQRQAAHLADDLPGDLNAGKQDVDAQPQQQADERFVHQQPAVLERCLSTGGSDVLKYTGVTSSDIATASSARTRRGSACEPKIGAVITSAPVRASTSVNTMNRLTRNVSSAGIRRAGTAPSADAKCQWWTVPTLRVPAHSQRAGNVRDQLARVLDQPRQHPRQRQAQRQHHRDQLRHERHRLLLNLRERLDQADDQAHDHAGHEHRRGNERRDHQRFAAKIDGILWIHAS